MYYSYSISIRNSLFYCSGGCNMDNLCFWLLTFAFSYSVFYTLNWLYDVIVLRKQTVSAHVSSWIANLQKSLINSLNMLYKPKNLGKDAPNPNFNKSGNLKKWYDHTHAEKYWEWKIDDGRLVMMAFHYLLSIGKWRIYYQELKQWSLTWRTSTCSKRTHCHSPFPAQPLAVIGTFWLGFVWHFPNPPRIPAIVPIAKNPIRLLLGSFAWICASGIPAMDGGIGIGWKCKEFFARWKLENARGIPIPK